MNLSPGETIYSGKAKTLFKTLDPDILWCTFRDDITAFNRTKTATIPRKGSINNGINAFLMDYLHNKGLRTHFISQVNADSCLVHKLQMIPIEFVIRNQTAGSLCRRLGVAPKKTIEPALIETYFKDDELGDPLVTKEHILCFGWTNEDDYLGMIGLTETINNLLKPLFAKIDLTLVDLKLEFGLYHGRIYLGDEITPDVCRLWDIHSDKIYDKDLFREDIGGLCEAYQEVANRLALIGSELSA